MSLPGPTAGRIQATAKHADMVSVMLPDSTESTEALLQELAKLDLLAERLRRARRRALHELRARGFGAERERPALGALIAMPGGKSGTAPS